MLGKTHATKRASSPVSLSIPHISDQSALLFLRRQPYMLSSAGLDRRFKSTNSSVGRSESR